MHELFIQMDTYFESLGTYGLALNSFIESFFLVPPPDFLLIAMDLAKPERALEYAFICSIASVLGGLVGYLIGLIGGRPVFNWIFRKHPEHYEKVEELYNKYGTAAVFFAGFTPLPYKVFTIASGILEMNWWKFTLASFFGRAGRFFIVSIVIMLFGEKIKQYIEIVIAAVSVLIILFFIVLYYKSKKNISGTKNNEQISEKIENSQSANL